MTDKKTLLAAALLIALASCSSGKKDEQKGPSAGQVMDKYVETVTTAKPKAEEAKKAEEKRQEEQKKIMNELDK